MDVRFQVERMQALVSKAIFLRQIVAHLQLCTRFCYKNCQTNILTQIRVYPSIVLFAECQFLWDGWFRLRVELIMLASVLAPKHREEKKLSTAAACQMSNAQGGKESDASFIRS